MRLTILNLLVLPVLLVLAAGCDSAEKFVFTNNTGERIHLDWRVGTDDDPHRRLDGGEYIMESGESRDTSVDPRLDGDLGSPLFTGNNVLVVTATAGEMIVFNRVFTYDELKDMDFRVAITDEG